MTSCSIRLLQKCLVDSWQIQHMVLCMTILSSLLKPHARSLAESLDSECSAWHVIHWNDSFASMVSGTASRYACLSPLSPLHEGFVSVIDPQIGCWGDQTCTSPHQAWCTCGVCHNPWWWLMTRKIAAHDHRVITIQLFAKIPDFQLLPNKDTYKSNSDLGFLLCTTVHHTSGLPLNTLSIKQLVE